MSMVVINLAVAALRDLEAVQARYVQQRGPDVGMKLVAEVFQRVQSLTDHPDTGRIVPEFNQPVLREFILPPFRTVYWLDPQRVRIVRIWKWEEDTDSASDIR